MTGPGGFDLHHSLVAVLDAANSEAKRRGHDRITIAHAAAAVAAIDPMLAGRAFPDDVLDAYETSLAALPITFDHPVPDKQLVQMLRQCVTQTDPLEALAFAIRLQLAGDGVQPERSRPADPPFALPDDVTAVASVVAPTAPLVDRDPVVEDLLALLVARQPQAPLLVAAEGLGRTTLASAVATRINESHEESPLSGWPVVITRSEGILTNGRVEALLRVLNACRDKAVVYIDDVEVICALGSPPGLDTTMLVALRSALHDPDVRVVMTVSSDFVDRFQAADRELFDELVRVDLDPLSDDEVEAIAQATAAELAAHHRVEVPDSVIKAALAPKTQRDVRSHPGLVVDRLERAAAAATLTTERVVQVADLGITSDVKPFATFDADAMSARLKTQVLGQDRSIDAVVNRLAITRDALDARPERPDGVFLLAGPTGTGKTELALRIAEDLYGAQDALIRLDMSEYADHWSLSKLIGSGPGYLGSTEPEGWLTTRVRQRPQCVLLLDEIEKADPGIWNTFLQVFDAGRLTDGQGRVAQFRDAIVIMTTNIGASEFADRNATGFATASDTADAETGRVLAEIKRTMRPELLNRLDATLVFRPLEPSTVRRIAIKQLDDAVARLGSRGWSVTYSDAVVDEVATLGYSREYGARPLLRVIEEQVLGRVRRLPAGAVRLDVRVGVIEAVPGGAP